MANYTKRMGVVESFELVDKLRERFILSFMLFPRISLAGKLKKSTLLSGSFILAFTFLVFFLDIATGEKIPFHIFYFPSIMLMTWFFGRSAGGWMVGLTALMWFLAEWDTGHFTSTAVFSQNGIIYLCTFLVIFRMTEIIHLKVSQLEEKSRELTRSNLELEQFAYKAAHDLQSPLATIFNYAEFLSEKSEAGPTDEKLTVCAEGILNGSKRMNLMIKSLLDYAKVAREEKQVPPVDLAQVVREVVETLQAIIAEKKAEVRVDPLPILAINPGLAGILFQNLIGNALKYCETVPIIHVAVVRQRKEWIFSVRDNGIGIPSESHKRVFIMFEKLATRREYPGSGIGLATCQRIVERYGGRIWVQSKPGEGSTFFFTLPAEEHG